MVAVEAAYFLPDGFDTVHVITTNHKDVEKAINDLQSAFSALHSRTELKITVTTEIADWKTHRDFEEFEEILFTWYLTHYSPDQTWVCLSGGYKSISASMQKAAGWFGARDIFHVLVENENSVKAWQDVEIARQEHRLTFFSMGHEPGWAFARNLVGFTNNTQITEWGWSVKPGPHQIRSHFAGVLNRIQSNLFTGLAGLPFRSLQFLSPGIWDWLHQPVNAQTDREWISRLPKIDLHLHLGGFATEGTLLEIVRNRANEPGLLPSEIPISYPSHWPLPAAPIALNSYMTLGNNNGSAILYDPGCLKEQCRQLFKYLKKERIVYAEIRCSPVNYAKGRSPLSVLTAIRETFRECIEDSRSRQEFTPLINLIIIVTRKTEGDLSSISKHLALAVTAFQEFDDGHDVQLVGVDLAGFENKETRAEYYSVDFEPVHRCGIAVTAHAGENDDAEGIWQAVYKLHARRLGHALRLNDSPDLKRTVLERRIGVELCPYSNYQTNPFFLDGIQSEIRTLEYPLLDYLRTGIVAFPNTDNPGISGAGLTDNFLLASRLAPGLMRIDLLQMIRHSAEVTFLLPDKRHRLMVSLEEMVLESFTGH